MNREQDVRVNNLESLLEKPGDEFWNLAQNYQQDRLFLLSLLRYLEQLHRKIRTDLFESSLPQTRNDLYQLVKDIDEKGGWPYIERMKIQELLRNLELDGIEKTESSISEETTEL
jgi:hypothetical protein